MQADMGWLRQACGSMGTGTPRPAQYAAGDSDVFTRRVRRFAAQGHAAWSQCKRPGGSSAPVWWHSPPDIWSLQFPIIKWIWTSSFVLVAGGYSLMLLGTFYLLIDVWGRKDWSTIFIWFGANAIALYMINNLMGFQGLARKLAAGDVATFLDVHFTTGAGSFVTVMIGLGFATFLARFLYRRAFLRV